MAKFKRGDPVSWPYRATEGHGRVVSIARQDSNPDKILYNVRQVDHHPGEPAIVQHTGAVLRMSTESALKAAEKKAKERS